MRVLLICACLAASLGWAADQREAASPIVPRGIPKTPAPKKPQLGPPLSNPGSPVARLYRASPEERDRALEKLPPKMQEQFRQQLKRFDEMPKADQAILIHRAERYAALSAEQKARFTQQMSELSKMADDRKREIGLALRRLQPLSQDERHKLVASDDFRGRFSPEEQQVITGLAAVMTPPNQ